MVLVDLLTMKTGLNLSLQAFNTASSGYNFGNCCHPRYEIIQLHYFKQHQLMNSTVVLDRIQISILHIL